MIYIGHSGCVSDQYIYMGGGSQHGSVWQNMDDGNYLKLANSFELLLAPSAPVAADARTWANNYNVLRAMSGLDCIHYSS